MVPQRQQYPLAHDTRLHPRVHRDPLLLHFRFDSRQLFLRGPVQFHRRRRAFRKRVAHRIDHVDQQQHRVLQPRQFLRATQSRRRLLVKSTAATIVLNGNCFAACRYVVFPGFSGMCPLIPGMAVALPLHTLGFP